MNSRVKNWLWNLVKFGITIAALVYLFMKIDMATFIDNVLKTNLLVIIFGGILVLFFMLLKVLKWKMLIGEGDVWFLMKSYFVAMFFGAFTPSKLGDFVRGFHVRKKYGMSLTRSMATVLYDRLLDVLAVFVFGLASVMFVFSSVGGNMSLVLLLAVGVVGIVISYFKLGSVLRILMKVFGKVVGTSRMKIDPEKITSEIEKISHKRKDIFVYTFLIWFLNYFSWWIFGLLLGFQTDFLFAFVAMNLSTVVGLLPITVGGFGARELSSVYFFVLFGYEKNIAFLFTILTMTLGILVPALIGAFFNIKSEDLKY